MNEPKFIIEEITDPGEIARHREQDAQFKRNADWLEAHWPDLLPQARGKFIAVAGQESFLADTPEGARELAEGAHPNDMGIFVQYVLPHSGPRIYGYLRIVDTRLAQNRRERTQQAERTKSRARSKRLGRRLLRARLLHQQ